MPTDWTDQVVGWNSASRLVVRVRTHLSLLCLLSMLLDISSLAVLLLKGILVVAMDITHYVPRICHSSTEWMRSEFSKLIPVARAM